MFKKTTLCQPLRLGQRDEVEPSRLAQAQLSAGRSLHGVTSEGATALDPVHVLHQTQCRFGLVLSLHQPLGYETGVDGHV